MRATSIFKILYLFNLLLEKDCTKNNIVEKFQNIGININKPTINKYVEKLKNNGIEIKILKEKKENLYRIEQNKKINFIITPKEMTVIENIKKLLIAQKNYNHIRKAMRIFYKFARYIENQEIIFIDINLKKTSVFDKISSKYIYESTKAPVKSFFPAQLEDGITNAYSPNTINFEQMLQVY
jgi:hypothetical protein